MWSKCVALASGDVENGELLKQRIAFYGLAVALALALAGLAVSTHRLSTVSEDRTRLMAWRTRILNQLGSAMSTNPAFDHSRPLPADDASDVLADIIGARDDALKMLAMPRPYQLQPPVNPEATVDRAMSGQAVPPTNISQLLNRQSTGTAGSDVDAIDHDSQSPWKGWE